MIRRRFLLFLGLGAAAPAAYAQSLAQSFEIIALRNRPAEQILPLLRPMLDRDGAISGSGFQLMVRTGPANLVQIRQMVESLDRAARQLIIEVRRDRSANSGQFDARGGVSISPGSARVVGAISDSSMQAAQSGTQQLRTQEGSAAFIGGGTSSLVPQRTVRRTVNGTVIEDTAAQRDIISGFYVIPRINGESVFLEVSTQRAVPTSGLGPGAAELSRVATTVSGRLGEWIELGGIDVSGTTRQSDILSSSTGSASTPERVWLRVTEAR